MRYSPLSDLVTITEVLLLQLVTFCSVSLHISNWKTSGILFGLIFFSIDPKRLCMFQQQDMFTAWKITNEKGNQSIVTCC